MRKPFLFLSLLTLSLHAFSQTIPDYIPTNNLVVWYPFSGNANDVSGNGNVTTNYGATLTTDRFGNPNAAYSFNGNNSQYFSCINNTLPMGKTKRTISLWLDPYSVISSALSLTALSYGSATNSHANMIAFGDGSKGVSFQGWGDDLNTYNTFSFNEWIHVLVTFDSLNVKVYVNNILLGSTQKPNWNTTGTAFNIGTRIDKTTGFFNGKIDDIAIWNRVLTPSEIELVFKSCSFSVGAQPVNDTAMTGNVAQFVYSVSDLNVNYKWQTDLGLGFQFLTNSGQYSGVNNDTLTISGLTLANNNQLFRCIISKDSCIDTSNISKLVVTNNTGIPTTNHENDIILYPNPATSVLYFIFQTNKKDFQYTITDLEGRKVKEGKVGSENSSITIEDLANGLYFIKINDHSLKEYKFLKN